MRHPSRQLALAALALAFAGCESTQEKSARLAKSGDAALNEKGLDVRKRNPDVKVVERAVLQDQYGAAVVVVLRSRAREPLRGVPVEIEVRDRRGRSAFSNNEPGIEASLLGPSVLPSGVDFAWVHDQVVVDGRAQSVSAVPGREKGTVRGELPKLQISPAHLEGDVTSGIEAVGTIANESTKDQRDLVLFCVARKGGRIVAAGRGQLPRLRAGKRRPYHIFFIGDPRGAKLTIEAPPTTL